MSLFSEFNILFPYLQSVRKLKNYLSFDLEFPTTWRLPKKFVDANSVIENEPKTENTRFLCFVAPFEENSIDRQITNIKNIIAFNKEREEKEKLFESKVTELKNIFEKQKLNDLQGLKFEINTNKILLEDEEEETNQVGKPD